VPTQTQRACLAKPWHDRIPYRACLALPGLDLSYLVTPGVAPPAMPTKPSGAIPLDHPCLACRDRRDLATPSARPTYSGPANGAMPATYCRRAPSKPRPSMPATPDTVTHAKTSNPSPSMPAGPGRAVPDADKKYLTLIRHVMPGLP